MPMFTSVRDSMEVGRCLFDKPNKWAVEAGYDEMGADFWILTEIMRRVGKGWEGCWTCRRVSCV